MSVSPTLGVTYNTAASILITSPFDFGLNAPGLHLFVSDSTPAVGDNPSAQYTEAFGINYAPLPLTIGYLQLVSTSPLLYALIDMEFNNVGPLSTGHDTVFGWWIDQVTTSSPIGMWGGRFAAPVVLNAAGQSLIIDVIELPLQDCGGVPDMTPTGVIVPWPSSVAPTGYLLCDGRPYSQTAYPNLFALLGSTWNTFRGQGAPPAGQFRVPLLNGLTIIGAGVGASSPTTSTRSLLFAGGEETHVLTSFEIPDNSLDIAGTSFLDTNTGFSNTPVAGDGGGGGGSLSAWKTGGGGLAHNNVQPSIALNYVIKT